LRRICVFVPLLPPSENKIRTITRAQMRGPKMIRPPMIIYTKEAQGWEVDFKAYLKAHHYASINTFRQGHTIHSVYSLTLRVFFETLVNKSWLSTGQSKAQTPYKRVDAPNRDKLVVDCFSSFLGIDDSLSMRVLIEKYMDPTVQGVELTLEEIDPRPFGIPDEYCH